MRNIFLTLLCVFSFSAHSSPIETPIAEEVSETHITNTVEATNLLTNVEKKVREASVKIYTPRGGHGSGGLIKHKDVQLVLTAHHVADGRLGQNYLITGGGEMQYGVLVYKDPLHDISVLYLPNKFQHYQPMKWKPIDSLATVGHEITYSGYPSWHNILTFRGHIAGYETIPDAGQQIILQTYGYFGCSGSVVYDTDGRQVGILWGIDSQRDGVHENIVWVAPIQNLDLDLALSALCENIPDKPRACR
tara:strand:+ start:3589 stop:4332 length:744 start_codon:yes stop_codon:yes gene_type:complete